MNILTKDDELTKGVMYRIRLTDGTWTDGVFLYEKQGTWGARTHFMFRNSKTGRTIEIKSKERIRFIPAMPVSIALKA